MVLTFQFSGFFGEIFQWIPGQYAILEFLLPTGNWISRSYTISKPEIHSNSILSNYSIDSSIMKSKQFCISIKATKFGIVSGFLHHYGLNNNYNKIQVKLKGIEGEFYIKENNQILSNSFIQLKLNPIIFISAGIGCTPFLAELDRRNSISGSDNSHRFRPIFWLHCERQLSNVPFTDEIARSLTAGALNSFKLQLTANSTTPAENKSTTNFMELINQEIIQIETGRINISTLKKIFFDWKINENLSNSDFYICGPLEFQDNIKYLIQQNSKEIIKNIFTEKFNY